MGRLIIKSCQEGKENSTNAFSSNLNTINMYSFPQPWCIMHLWKDLSLTLIVKRIMRVCRVQFPSCWS